MEPSELGGVMDDTEDINIESDDIDYLIDCKMQLEAQISGVKAELDKAKRVAYEKGKFKSASWMNTRESKRQALIEKKSKLERKIRAAKRIDRKRLDWLFVDVARAELDSDTFKAIMSKAQAKLHTEHNNGTI